MRVLILDLDASGQAAGSQPPRAVALAATLHDTSHEVVLISSSQVYPVPGVPAGVRVERVTEAPPIMSPGQAGIAPVLALDSRAFTTAARLAEEADTDCVCTTGWQATNTAANLRAVYGLPIVAHLTDTELQRRGGHLPDDASKLVLQMEWWLTYEARYVVVPSAVARQRLIETFQLPPRKVVAVRRGARRHADVIADAIRDERALPTGHDDVAALRPALLRSPLLNLQHVPATSDGP